MIYFAQEIASLDSPIKIGSSNNVVERIKNLSYQNGVRLKILGILDGDIKQEKMLHHKFRSIQIYGEWFESTGELLDFIEKNALSVNIQHDIPKRCEGIAQSGLRCKAWARKEGIYCTRHSPFVEKCEYSQNEQKCSRSRWRNGYCRRHYYVIMRIQERNNRSLRTRGGGPFDDETTRFDKPVIDKLCDFFGVPEGPIPFLHYERQKGL